MDIRNVLFNAQGRIGPNDFWRGVIILTGVQIVITLVSAYGPDVLGALGTMITFSLVYPYLCVYGKRLHDSGRSAWFFVGCLLASFIVSMLSNYVFISLFIGDAATYYTDILGAIEAQDTRAAEALASQAIAPSLLSILVVNAVVGVLPARLAADPNDNAYGPASG